MSFQVFLTERANLEFEQAAQWWEENHSREQADRWYENFAEAIDSLSLNPMRCATARENKRFPIEIRQLNFGVGNKKTHRAVFTIRGEQVVVFAIRHLARLDLDPDDLP